MKCQLCFPYNLYFRMKIHAVFRFDLLLHFMDEGQHILAAGVAVINEESCMLLANLRISHRKTIENELLNHLSHEVTVRPFEGTAGAPLLQRLLRPSTVI